MGTLKTQLRDVLSNASLSFTVSSLTPVLDPTHLSFQSKPQRLLVFLSKDLLFSTSNEITEIRLLLLSPFPPFLFYKSHYKGVKY